MLVMQENGKAMGVLCIIYGMGHGYVQVANKA